MEGKVLVAYATKYGATEGIAEKIGAVLREQGLDVDVTIMQSVGDPQQYGAFVIGSSVYFGKWRKEATAFLETNENLLAQKPVWLFTDGPTGEGDPAEATQGWVFPKALEVVKERIQPRGVALFFGKIDVEKLGWLEKQAIKKVKSPVGDSRDWDAISSWAKDIAASLKE